MKVFENRKAEKLFYDLSEGLKGKKKDEFTNRVKAFFDIKVTADEDTYGGVFKITERDVAAIYDGLMGKISAEEYSLHDCHASPEDGCSVCVDYVIHQDQYARKN